jgi:dGTPase
MLNDRRLVHETVRRMIGALVADLLAESGRRIVDSGVATLDDIRQAPTLVGFTPVMREENRTLKRFLLENLYRHPRVVATTERARQVVHALFSAYHTSPALLPSQYQQSATAELARTVADYIAGMTDRYAIDQYRRLFGSTSETGDWNGLSGNSGNGY